MVCHGDYRIASVHFLIVSFMYSVSILLNSKRSSKSVYNNTSTCSISIESEN